MKSESEKTMAERKVMLCGLRAQWAITKTLAHQIESAIAVLVDEKFPDVVAMETATTILKANIGP